MAMADPTLNPNPTLSPMLTLTRKLGTPLPTRVFATLTGVHGWSYYYSDKTMNWSNARKWCQAKYTDLVAIQNKEEIAYLNEILPPQPKHYWIGIRKRANVWTWVGTQKQLTEEASNWATGEPNNSKRNEDCVEIYIKRENDTGKWNDESCRRNKTALCYTASCQPDSCSPNGECVETINNHTCKCLQGFFGKRCEYAVSCEEMDGPNHGLFSCTHPFGNFSYGSECKFSCEDGYQLVGSRSIECTASREWSAAPPSCEAVRCPSVQPPQNGNVTCADSSGDLLYGSNCSFSCDPGFILHGSEVTSCGKSGDWIGGWPVCQAVPCPSVQPPQNGSITCADSSGDLLYGSNCSFSCDPGFILHGSEVMTCGKSGDWIGERPVCQAVRCRPLQVPEGGSVSCSRSSEDLLYGSSCSFSCADGHQLQGASSVICMASAQWSAETPICKAVHCPSVQPPQNGSVTCADSSGDLLYRSNCSFSCDPGFILHGSEVTTCGKSGDWIGERPLCQAKQFDVKSFTEDGTPPEVYKNSIESLI
ncbi:L-selectin-like [Megalops cyprinoides]|uniref:L-selectin-like n=1 Tax=Megalops cyprinoides TaxID=118141 RepID=UPI001864D127|nr:L-selectin-like [Megalops cyprinoides]